MTTAVENAVTPYPDVNDVLNTIERGCADIFGDNLVGLYLFGSLSYGDFNPESSDIDLVAILNQPASERELELIQQLHMHVGKEHPKWADRLECSYTPREMLQHVQPPQSPRPYVGEGIFYPEAQYGNEWIINLYLLYQHGITLFGPDFKALIAPVPIIEVEKACIRDLYREWEPKISDLEWLGNSHYQSYLVLNLCRILYTVLQHETGSKVVSARWVKKAFPQWIGLIAEAESWQYGAAINRRDETISFIRFAVEQVESTPLYAQLPDGSRPTK